MNATNSFLVIALVLFASAVSLRLRRQSAGSRPVQAAATEATEATALKIESVIVPRYHATRLETGNAAGLGGQVRFEVGEGEELVGIGAATVYGDRRGHPGARPIADFSGVQFQGGLILEPWLRQRAPTGPHHLLCGLWVRQGDRTEARRIWCRIDPVALYSAALIVDASGPAARPIRVETAGGQPVPGAVLGIDPDGGLPPGVYTTYAYTDATGTAWLSGHADGRRPSVRLLDGVGPAGELQVQDLDAGGTIRVAGLTGDWTFVRWDLEMPLRGLGARLDSWEVLSNKAVQMWPVSRWLAPGRCRGAPLYWMLPAAQSTDEPMDVRVSFRGHESCVVHCAEQPQVVRFSLKDRRVAATLR